MPETAETRNLEKSRENRDVATDAISWGILRKIVGEMGDISRTNRNPNYSRNEKMGATTFGADYKKNRGGLNLQKAKENDEEFTMGKGTLVHCD